jgi:hypothetical protein
MATAMPQIAEARVQRYRSACCDAPIGRAAFSDGRRFLICSACAKVLAVERQPARKTA